MNTIYPLFQDYLSLVKSKKLSVIVEQNRLVAFSNQKKTYWSIQVIENQDKQLPVEVAISYFQWLTDASNNIIIIQIDRHCYKLFFRFLKIPLLLLTLTYSDEQKAIFHVSGGLLAKKNPKAFFIFSKNLNNDLIVLEDFQPRLPWFLYRITQAPIHEFVMQQFQKKKKNKST